MSCKDCHKLLGEIRPTCEACVDELRAENDRLQKCYDVTNQSWKELQAELNKYKSIIALLKEKTKLTDSITPKNCAEVIEKARGISAQIDELIDGLEG